MLTTDEVHLLFTHEAVGIHNPLAIYNAMILLCSILGRRARDKLRNTCLGDLKIEVVDENQFVTLDKD